MLNTDNTLLVIVDIQEKLAPAIYKKDELIAGAAKLINSMNVLEVPIIYTEQNPDGLGSTVEPLKTILGDKAITKIAFSCCGEPAFVDAVKATARKQVILAGMETHVCVYQTARDLIEAGYDVHVVADAVSSRTPENKQIGLDKIKSAGAEITSVETAVFELLKVASGDKFRQILKIVK